MPGCCATCPCRDEPFDCLVMLEPDRYAHLGVFCRADPADATPEVVTGRRQVVDRSRGIIEPGPAIPDGPLLAGDIMAALAKKIGVDRAAKFVAAKLGTECGCSGRQALFNRLDAKLRKWLGL